jgi:Protein of unknown function (DUF1822)
LEAVLSTMRGSMLQFYGIQPIRGNVRDDIRGDDSIRKRVEQLYRRQSSNQERPVPDNLNPQDALVDLIQTTQDDEIRWQSAELLWELDPHHPICPVISAKDLELYLMGHAVALMVGMLPKPDGKLLMLVRMYPMEQRSSLPPGLKMIGLDEIGGELFQVESRQRDDYMQFKFTADEGDRFSVRVVLKDASFTESFVV